MSGFLLASGLNAPSGRNCVNDSANLATPAANSCISSADLKRLAALVLKPGAVRLYTSDGTNQLSQEWLNLEEAIAMGRPFCGTLHDDVFVFDADNVDQVTVLDKVAQELSRYSLPIVIENSGGLCQTAGSKSPRRHLWANIPSKTLMTYMIEFACHHAGTRCVVSPRRFFRPPLSPHRSGTTPVLVVPTDIEEAISSLTPILSPFDPRLSEKMRNLLRDGDVRGDYAKGSPKGHRDHAIHAVVTAMVASGWGKDRIFGAIMNPKNRVGEKWQDIACVKPNDAERRLENSLRRAVDRVKKHPTVSRRLEPMRRIETQIQTLIQVHLREFSGQRARTAFAVLCAHLHTAHRLGRIYYALSDRTACVFSRVTNRGTILSSNRWLEERGFIRGVGVRTRGRLTRFELTIETALTSRRFHHQGELDNGKANDFRPFCSPLGEGEESGSTEWSNVVPPQFDPSLHPLPEAFASGKPGLSFAAMFVWMVADDRAEDDIVGLLGTERSSVGRHLKRLQGLGLARREGASWQAIRSRIALDAAARTLGVLGSRDKIRLTFEKERVKFRGTPETRARADG